MQLTREETVTARAAEYLAILAGGGACTRAPAQMVELSALGDIRVQPPLLDLARLESCIRGFREHPERMPPVILIGGVVFDGNHRLAAARILGLSHISIEYVRRLR